MSFLKGSSNMAVLRFTEANRPTIDQIIEAFNGSILMDPKNVNETEVEGWSNSTDILRRHLSYEDVVGTWFHCNYVKCVKKIPSALKKVHMIQAIEEYRIANFGKSPKGSDKAVIEEDVEKKLAPFAVPTFKTVPILVNSSEGYVFVGTNKLAALDDVNKLIRQSFEASPVELEWVSSMSGMMESAGIKYMTLEQAEPAFVPEKPIEMNDTVAQEFVSWLYYWWNKDGKISDADLLFEEGMKMTNLSDIGPLEATLGKGTSPLEGSLVWEMFEKAYLLSDANIHLVTHEAVPQDYQFGLDRNMMMLKVKPPKKTTTEERFEYFKRAFETLRDCAVREFAITRGNLEGRWDPFIREFRGYVLNKVSEARIHQSQVSVKRLEEAIDGIAS